MAKKFVRGVTGIENIESYDKTLTNVNDILSDGQDTYVHTKKGKTESYYKLTDSLKSITSDNSDLITVTKDDTTNTATLHPKHDAQKEQKLESTNNTITIQASENGTSGTTKVDTNPQKVLEHDNLTVTDGLTKDHTGNTTTIKIDPKRVLFHDYLTGEQGIEIIHLPEWFGSNVKLSDQFVATVNGKQNSLTSSTSIGVLPNNSLRQLYSSKYEYTDTNGALKTHVKSISDNTDINNAEEEFNFIVKINKGASSVNFTLNSHDSTKFQNIISTYGTDNAVNINGCVFTLSGSTLTVSTTNNTAQNYVITFSDII